MFVAVLTLSVLVLSGWPAGRVPTVLAIGQAPDDSQGIPISLQQEEQLLQGLGAPVDAIGAVRDVRGAATLQTYKGKPTPCLHRGKNVYGQCLQLKECYPYYRFPEAEPWRYGIYDSCNDLREGVQEYGVCCVQEEGDTNLIDPQDLPQVYDQISINNNNLPGLMDRSHVQFRPSRPNQNITRSPAPAWERDTSYPLFPAHPTHPPLPTHPPSHTNQPWWNPQGGQSSQPSTPRPPPIWTQPPISTHYPPSVVITPRPPSIWTQPPTTKRPTTTRRTTQLSVVTAPPSFGSTNPCAAGSFYHINDTIKQNIWDANYGSLPRVVGGFPSRPHSHPWLATLFNGHKQFCGGSLIDNTHILTAAHCIAHMSSVDVSRLRVRLGAHNIKTSETTVQEFKVIKVVRHKDYDARKLYNDVAMLTLDRPAEYNNWVRPICLASGGSWVDDMVTVAGWGSLSEGGQQPSTLYEVRLEVWSLDRCSAYYGTAAPGGIVSSYICAGTGGKDSCMGDSGGPLVKNINNVWTQIGIVSWGIGCGKGHYPGVYSRVPSFLSWINRVKNIYR